MQVIIVLERREAEALHNSIVQELFKVAQEFNVTLKPMHPGTRDKSLLKYFIIEVADSSKIEKAKHRFNEIAGVKAYIKPQDELP